MRSFLSVLLLAAGLGFSGAAAAASAPSFSVASLLTVPVTDIQTADATAVANGDTLADTCYKGALAYIATLPNQNPVVVPTLGAVKGVVSTFEDARVTVKAGEATLANFKAATAGGPIPKALIVPCGPLALDVQNDLGTLANQTGLGFANVVLFHKPVF